MERVHATSVAKDGKAVLLRGKPGSGKSDLALRLIDDGWDLVADDYTELEDDDGVLRAQALATIQGLLEVRGVGIVRIDSAALAQVVAVFDLVELCDIERLPEPATTTLLGLDVPLYVPHGLDASAPAKVRMALKAQTEGLFHQS